ncbi:MAG: MlaC/ttg2D family ABC transporter substrate-binding protein [Caulobacterales bacterium]|uniref:MlaC/ttg2D family ABC transporter substrate-binding protein n=1 Tax=Glycocaulis sp. TaxID=1969725 RepID=UPI003F9FADCA
MLQTISRLTAPIVAAFTIFAFTPALAAAQTADQAESFVQREAQEVIDALQAYRDGELDEATLRENFRERVDILADVPRITQFVLGRYRRGADEADLEEFSAVFREFAINVYERELGNYAGQTLEVTGSITRAPGDYIVESVVRANGAGEDVPVNWRVMAGDSGMRVVDAEVLGVWLAQTQREQITGIIGNAGGDISAATRALRERTN